MDIRRHCICIILSVRAACLLSRVGSEPTTTVLNGALGGMVLARDLRPRALKTRFCTQLGSGRLVGLRERIVRVCRVCMLAIDWAAIQLLWQMWIRSRLWAVREGCGCGFWRARGRTAARRSET